MPRKISVGLDLSSPTDLPVALDSAVSAGFDFVIAPLFHPRFRRDADCVSERRDGPGTRSDLVMTSDRWSACVVGKLSPWLDLDSPVTATRLASEKALKQEVAWASHLTVPAVLVPPPCPDDCSNYAMLLNQTVAASAGVHFWVTIPTSYGNTAGATSAAAPTAAAGMAVDGSSSSAAAGAAAVHAAAGLVGPPRGFGAPLPPSGHAPLPGHPDYDSVLPVLPPASGAAALAVDADRLQRELMLVKTPAPVPARAAAGGAGAASGAASTAATSAAAGSASAGVADELDPWDTWNRVRALTEYSPAVSVALLITADLPCSSSSSSSSSAVSSSSSTASVGSSAGASSPPAATLTAAAGAGAAAAAASPAIAVAGGAGGAPSCSSSGSGSTGSTGSASVSTTPGIPGGTGDPSLDRWLGEPVKAAILPTSTFRLNKRGFPILPVQHQRLLLRLHARRVQFVLTGRPADFRSDAGLKLYADTPYAPYMQYIEHVLRTGGSTGLRRTAPKAKGGSAGAAAGGAGAAGDDDDDDGDYDDYYDVLQAPLQPLADNLESQTYETFERDAPKYDAYEAAMASALAETPADATTVLMVVGAGRGPLVHRALRAAATTKRAVRVYAVEKNPNALITLRNLRETAWGDRVSIVSSDMRTWKAPELADILVSELLGSFGDNELSPECLDGAQRFLGPGGVSIPSSYTSFLAPVMSSKLWNEVKAYKEPRYFETAYVARMFQYASLAPPQAAFTFVHPNRASAIDNRRYAVLRFTAACSGVVHGLAGTFDATLHGAAHVSIHPHTHTPGMLSWFPLFFPFKDPLHVRAGEAIEVRMWRCVGAGKVWYEWALTAPGVTAVHNPGGRSYYIGL